MEYKIITYWFLLTILIDIVLLTDDRVRKYLFKRYVPTTGAWPTIKYTAPVV